MSLRVGAAVVGGLLLLGLAGCATGGSGPGAGPSPSGVRAGEIAVDAAWLDGGRMIAVVTPGSSTCAPIVGEVDVESDGTLDVGLVDAEGVACTADSVPRAVGVVLPEGVDPTRDLAVRVTYGIDSWGETDLDGFDGAAVEEYTPSAGWVDDGLFALVTWGSSGCVPEVESVKVAAADAVTVTFVTPPADQVCTMDMGPRIALVSVDGVDDDAAVTLTLTGGSDFGAPMTVPIEG